LTVTAGAASQLAFAQAPSAATAGAVIEPAPTVRIQDAEGNLVTSTASVTLAITAATGTAGASLGGTVTVAAVGGVATFSTLTIDKAGAGYTLTATSGSLSGATSATFTISANPPTNLAYPSPTTTATAGTAGTSGTPTLTLGGATAVRFAITVPSPVPEGLIIDSLTGVVAFSATVTPATYALTITATTAGGTITAPLTLVLQELPGAATNVVTTPRNALVEVAWDRPARDGSSPITGYRLQYTINDGATWVQAPDVTGANQRTTSITGLTNNAIYRVRVAAVSAVGTGAYSAPSAPVIPAEPVLGPGTQEPPDLPPGQTLVVVGGEEKPSTLAVVQDTILRLTGGDFILQLGGLTDAGEATPIDTVQSTLLLEES
jgi:hypothetical protein